MGALLKSRTLCLQQLVDAVGLMLSEAPALGSLLGLHSVRVARRLLELWSQRLTGKERSLLTNYSQRKVEPDPADPFPEIYLSPGLGELTGPLLATTCPEKLTLHKADKKTLYFNCVKGTNRKGLCNRLPTVWVFIMGAAYKKAGKEKWQLLNYLSGEAKMAIYLSRKNRVEIREGQEARSVWLCNIKARLWLEFR
ncbi:hypothetical protein VZT92_008342 [Zoarces viviparus]